MGPAILAGGYRIFFSAAAVWAVTALTVWLLYLTGFLGGIDADMLAWHAHELVFGYGGAVVAGFALTAIPNWTGRKPVSGTPLGMLFLIWLLARMTSLAMLAGYIGATIPALAESIFFISFFGLAAREVLAAHNARNYKIIAIFGFLLATAIGANLQRMGVSDIAISGWRPGLGVLILLICIIGGRIIPAFTGNWMRQQHMEKMPVPFNKFDAATILATAAALGLFVVEYSGKELPVFAALAAVLNLTRLVRWRGWKTTSSPIVLMLHVSYLWIPLGFLMLALAGFGLVAETSALHAWTVGGIGGMTLAVMTRASLGHAGMPLDDSVLLTSIYLGITLSALVRVSAGIWPDTFQIMIQASGLLWCAAFLLFLWRFAPIHFAK